MRRRPVALRPLLGSVATAAFLSATLAWAAQPAQDAAGAQPPRPVAAPPAGAQAAAPPAPPRPRATDVQLSPAQVALLSRTLANAAAHGLPPAEFDVTGLDAAIKSGMPNAQAPLIQATLRYAKAVHSGQLPEDGFMRVWGLKPPAYDPTAGFIQAVKGNSLKAWLDSLPPPYTGYEDLQKGLTVYEEIADHGGWKAVPAGPDLKQGMSDPRVVALRNRLAAEDPKVAAGGSPVFDAALSEAVIRAQKRYGLAPTGVVSTQTVSSLNVPVKRRIDQIRANMERWRWLPPSLPSDRVQVNIAAAVLTVFRDDAPVMSMRAVTGRPGDETPMLQSKIHSIVFNPPWNVPSSIATKELWPKEKANPGYLARHGFTVIKTDGGGVRLQQKAGAEAALGYVKFDFANDYGVYLHDTPSRSGFDRYGRLSSHGCVRLQKPVPLAKLLLSGDDTWTPDYVDQTLDDKKTVRAQLPQQIAVFLLYWTAYVAPDGSVNFRDDPYGWDTELVQRIAAAHGSAV